MNNKREMECKVPKRFTETILRTSKKLYKNEGKNKYKILKPIIAACACATLTTGIVFAKDISNYVSKIFNLTSIGMGDNILQDSLNENEYIPLSNEYISANDVEYKANYLMIDDINILLSIDFKTKFNISEYDSLSFINLKIFDEKGNQVFVDSELESEHSKNIAKAIGYYTVNKTDNNITEGIILNCIENISTLQKFNIKFDGIRLYNVTNSNVICKEINDKFELSVDLNDKINKDTSIKYSVKNNGKKEYTDIKNAVLTTSGMGIRILSNSTESFDINITDMENNKIYYKVNSIIPITIDNGIVKEYFVWLDVDTNIEKYKLQLEFKKEKLENYTEEYIIEK